MIGGNFINLKHLKIVTKLFRIKIMMDISKLFVENVSGIESYKIRNETLLVP